jgi:hypothetical protein
LKKSHLQNQKKKLQTNHQHSLHKDQDQVMAQLQMHLQLRKQLPNKEAHVEQLLLSAFKLKSFVRKFKTPIVK